MLEAVRDNGRFAFRCRDCGAEFGAVRPGGRYCPECGTPFTSTRRALVPVDEIRSAPLFGELIRHIFFEQEPWSGHEGIFVPRKGVRILPGSAPLRAELARLLRSALTAYFTSDFVEAFMARAAYFAAGDLQAAAYYAEGEGGLLARAGQRSAFTTVPQLPETWAWL
ncbi:hypothetical protein G3N55_02145 [Dissulfurirhabdus thermomarina]|uniref:Uncharacterized protein n=1 Tax=Dissulfurirhabdus thermomarina TaxID=1765737 RepID=A0A6N9TPJ1_DISTH|nr:hypothetical protein [Dissulfurirhabdus thermomarina]NDY41654.1 hypothetical protein [Dissulfurirhabdus thermomarina]NMX24346.1 hypothetical protein [Dissulfurirhabdus thermomarina]